MKKLPYMPLWVDRYISDTEHLNNEEHGIYLRLLMLMWKSPYQRVPNDKEWLSRRLKEYPDKIYAIVDEFCQCDGNWITNRGVARAWHDARGTSERMSALANQRWFKEKAACSPCNASKDKTKTKEVRKKVYNGKHALPDNWNPSEGNYKRGKKLGLSTEQVDESATTMRDWANGNGEKKDNWWAFFNYWLTSPMNKRGTNGRVYGVDRNGQSFHERVYEGLDKAYEEANKRAGEGEGDSLRGDAGKAHDGLLQGPVKLGFRKISDGGG